MSFRYADCGDAHIAYRMVGDGPLDLVSLSSLIVSFEDFDESPHTARFDRRLASFARLIQIDCRGLGLSDAGDRPPTLELIAEDIITVLDAAESTKAVLLGVGNFAPFAVRVAASVPERVHSLVLVNTFASLIKREGYDAGYPEEVVSAFTDTNIDPSASNRPGRGHADLDLMAPSLKHDPRFVQWWDRSSQRAASPATARRFLAMTNYVDIRNLLPAIAVPTLVICTRDDRLILPRMSYYLAEHIPAAKLVELPGADHLPFSGDADALLDEVEEFVTGRRSGSADRVLATLLFTDIVDSTVRAQELGDRAWRAELDAHDAAVRLQLTRFGGREVNTTGDGFVALFATPTSALECARAITAGAGLPVRAGVHLGECEQRGDDVAGLAVHIAARVAASAEAGEVRVSRTVRDAVAGSGLAFEACGAQHLKGLDEPWELFALASAVS